MIKIVMAAGSSIFAIIASTQCFAAVVYVGDGQAHFKPVNLANADQAGAGGVVRSDEADRDDDVIVVTANKREQAANDVPLSISVVGGDDMSDLGIRDVADLTKVVPGLNYSQSNQGRPVFTLRGIGFNATYAAASPTVSVYVDEIPLPYSILTRGATLDLSRVEVLKGPQGILFGQNATGGAINYIAAKPTESFTAGLEASYGRFSTFQAEGYLSGPLSPTLSARVAVRTEQSGPWQKSYTQDLELGRQDFTAFRALLDWEPDSNFNAQLRFSGFVDKSENQATQFLTVDPSANAAVLGAFVPSILTYPVAPEKARAADWSGGQALKRDNVMLEGALRLEYFASDVLKLTSLTSYADYDEQSLADYDGLSLRNNQIDSNTRLHSFNQEIRASGAFDEGRLNYVIGGNYEKSRIDEATLLSLPESSGAYAIGALVQAAIPILSDATPTNLNRSETWALFGNLDYEISPTVTVSAGMRYTKSEIDFEACTRSNANNAYGINSTALANFLRGAFFNLPPIAPIGPGGCGTFNEQFEPVLFSDTLKEDNISWRVVADWKPLPGTLLYASITRGYKAGSFPAISTSQAAQYAPVTQEAVTSYEAGIKSSVIDRILQFNGAFFYYDYKDKQILNAIPVAVFGQLPALVNVPDSRVIGGEVQFDLTPTSGLHLGFGATYVDSKIGEFSAFSQLGDFVDQSGRPFPNTPKYQVTASADYTFPVNDNLNAFFGANYSYRSSTNASLEEDPLFHIRGYGLLDLRAGVEGADKRFKASIWGRNVTNEYYWHNTNISLDSVVRVAGRPVTYGLTVGYRFD